MAAHDAEGGFPARSVRAPSTSTSTDGDNREEEDDGDNGNEDVIIVLLAIQYFNPCEVARSKSC